MYVGIRYDRLNKAVLTCIQRVSKKNNIYPVTPLDMATSMTGGLLGTCDRQVFCLEYALKLTDCCTLIFP